MLVLLSEPDAWFGLRVHLVVLCYHRLVAALLKQKLVNMHVIFDLSSEDLLHIQGAHLRHSTGGEVQHE